MFFALQLHLVDYLDDTLEISAQQLPLSDFSVGTKSITGGAGIAIIKHSLSSTIDESSSDTSKMLPIVSTAFVAVGFRNQQGIRLCGQHALHSIPPLAPSSLSVIPSFDSFTRHRHNQSVVCAVAAAPGSIGDSNATIESWTKYTRSCSSSRRRRWARSGQERPKKRIR